MRFRDFLIEASQSGPKVALEFQMLVPLTSEEILHSIKPLVSGAVKLHEPDSDKKRSLNAWHVIPDSTIGEHGVELQSPAVPLNDSLRDLGKICDWMRENDVKTNDSSSLKAIISFPNITDKLDPVKLVIITGNAERALGKWSGKFTPPQIEMAINKLKQTGKLPESFGALERDAAHFLNIKSTDRLSGSIQLRIGSGADYESDVISLKRKIFKLVNSIETACDPAAARSEYTQKLTKILGEPNEEQVTGNNMHALPEQLHRLYRLNAHVNEAYMIFEKDQTHGDARHSLLVLINTALKTAKDYKTSLTLAEKTLFKKLARQVALQSSDVDEYYSNDHIARLNFKRDIGV